MDTAKEDRRLAAMDRQKLRHAARREAEGFKGKPHWNYEHGGRKRVTNFPDIDLKGAAELLHVKERKVKELARAGLLKCFRPGKGVYLFYVEWLVEYGEQTCRRTTWQSDDSTNGNLADSNSPSVKGPITGMQSGTTTASKKRNDFHSAAQTLAKPSAD